MLVIIFQIVFDNCIQQLRTNRRFNYDNDSECWRNAGLTERERSAQQDERY